MNFLEEAGIRYLEKELKRKARLAINEIKNHITKELERVIMPLQETVERLITAFTNELDQVRQEASAGLEKAQADLAAADAENDELTAALEAQVASYESLVATVDSAQNRMEQVSSELEANDPAPVAEGDVPPATVVDEPVVDAEADSQG